MRVLWIAPNGGCFNLESQKGGGWVSSLEKALVQAYPNFQLGIAFLYGKQVEAVNLELLKQSI